MYNLHFQSRAAFILQTAIVPPSKQTIVASRAIHGKFEAAETVLPAPEPPPCPPLVPCLPVIADIFSTSGYWYDPSMSDSFATKNLS